LNLATPRRPDLLYPCLARSDHPGDGYFPESGETTWPEYGKIVGHSGRIHTCYTGVAGYFTRAIGGIRADPSCYGMRKFIVKPNLLGDLTCARTTSGSYYGTMVSNWSRSGNTGTFHLELPPNTTAKVYIPARSIDDILEGGRAAATAAGVTRLDGDGPDIVFQVDSGDIGFPVHRLHR